MNRIGVIIYIRPLLFADKNCALTQSGRTLLPVFMEVDVWMEDWGRKGKWAIISSSAAASLSVRYVYLHTHAHNWSNQPRKFLLLHRPWCQQLFCQHIFYNTNAPSLALYFIAEIWCKGRNEHYQAWLLCVLRWTEMWLLFAFGNLTHLSRICLWKGKLILGVLCL